MDDYEYGQSRQQQHYPLAAIVHCGNDNSCSDERSPGGKEPPADYGNHAGDAEHGTFTPPGSVGERSTHSDHKCYESG